MVSKRQPPHRDGHCPPERGDILLDDLPRLTEGDGSTWCSDGQPFFAPRDDTSVLWPLLQIAFDPRSRRIFRLG
jgi:hypothetical protein